MLCCIAFFYANNGMVAQPLTHPGILHSKADLQRMKDAVADKTEPVYAGYQLFIQNPASQFNYQMQGPLPTVSRNPTVGQTAYDNDANAAHQNAVMWAITGDKRYAAKAIEIVNAWSFTLQSITGKDAVLMAGLGPFKMINAAEILRYTGSGWKEGDIRQAEQHFIKVIYPVLKDFAPFANGNWDAAAMKTVMAIAVFCNNRPLLERALRYYTNGHGNGRLTHYIVNTDGQVQESGRDQAHTQLGMGMLAECCAIAWNQGLNLYAYENNRLLKGFEYTAKYNLGEEVPFTEWLDRTGKYHHTKISPLARGDLRAVYEQVYNHYTVEQELKAPYMEQAVTKLRPEGPGKPGADHPGYGTLYFASKKKDTIHRLSAPAAIIANSSNGAVTLTWIAATGADAYAVKRAAKRGGPYSIIADAIKETGFTDTLVKPGTVYYYTVTASNKKGQSGNGFETSAAAGLPAPWKQTNSGHATGTTSFDGKLFTIETTGGHAESLPGAFHYTWQPVTGNCELVARFVPQTSSQFSQMGLLMRAGLSDSTSFVSLIILPVKTRDAELPDWCIKLTPGPAAGIKTDTGAHTLPLAAPAVSWGRLTGNIWLRMQRKGDNFKSAFSYDGKVWKALPDITMSAGKTLLTGMAVCSGMPGSTRVIFDCVALKK